MNWIENSALKEQLEPEIAARLGAVSTHVFPKGATLFRPGESALGFAVVLTGRVGVYLTGASGREILLYSVEPGQTCIQTTLGLLGGELYAGEGVCETETKLAMIPNTVFQEVLASSPAFRTYVFRAFSRRLQNMMDLLEQVAFVRVEYRLATALLSLAKNGIVLATHADLATHIGSAREVVSRRLEAMAKRGLVALDRGSITILDPAALEVFSQKR